MNVDGVVFGVQALTPRMREGSVFVVTASLAGLIPMESDPLYVLTKHAVVGYARSMAPLLEPRGIRINLVCPGIVRTPMTEPAQADLDAAGFPLMEPEQIADAVLVARAAKRPARRGCASRAASRCASSSRTSRPRVEGAEAWFRSSSVRSPATDMAFAPIAQLFFPNRPSGRVRGQSRTGLEWTCLVGSAR